MWQIGVVRAAEDRIIIEGIDGVVPFWFSEKPNHALDDEKDRLRQTARAVPPGSWGKPHRLPRGQLRRDQARKRSWR
jgi:hypothetical protein